MSWGYVEKNPKVGAIAHSVVSLKKQLGVAAALGARPGFIMVSGCLFEIPHVIRISPHCHCLGTYCSIFFF